MESSDNYMEKYKMKNLIKFSKWLQSLQYRHATQTEMITLLFNNEILISKVKLLNKKDRCLAITRAVK